MEIVVVKKGDTLYKIAKENRILPELLISANKIKNPDNLVVGQTIVIPENNEKLGNIAVNGYLYPNINRDILKEALPYLTFLTIFAYGFEEDGTLIPTNDDEIIEIALKNNVAPIMLISTLNKDGKFSNSLANKILNNEVAQKNLVNNIIENLKRKKYFGLDIDFEYILPEDAKNFSNFVKNITNSLNNEGFPVITALAPKTSAEQKGLLYEAHNYKEIGKNSNAVLLMTYEWGFSFPHTRLLLYLRNVFYYFN